VKNNCFIGCSGVGWIFLLEIYMIIFIEKVYEPNNVKKGVVKLKIYNQKPKFLIPEVLLTEIEVNDECLIEFKL